MAFEDFISGFGLLIAAGSFVWGVRAWRSSFIGQRKIELAEEVHELFLTCVDHIAAIRSPLSHGDEGDTRWKDGTETPERSKLLNQAYVPIERINNRIADFNKLMSRSNRFDLYFGTGASKPIQSLNAILREIQGASIDLSYIWPRQGTQFPSQEAFEQHLAEMHAAQNIIWAGHRDDALAAKITSAVNGMMLTCTQAINPQPNVWQIGRAWLLWGDRFWRFKPNDN